MLWALFQLILQRLDSQIQHWERPAYRVSDPAHQSAPDKLPPELISRTASMLRASLARLQGGALDSPLQDLSEAAPLPSSPRPEPATPAAPIASAVAAHIPTESSSSVPQASPGLRDQPIRSRRSARLDRTHHGEGSALAVPIDASEFAPKPSLAMLPPELLL